MSLPVVLTYEAETDFDAAADWYQAHGDLGARFTTHVREALNRIGQMPESYAVHHRDIRRAQVRKFPYNVFFRLHADRVEVIAVLHGCRDPAAWKSRAF